MGENTSHSQSRLKQTASVINYILIGSLTALLICVGGCADNDKEPTAPPQSTTKASWNFFQNAPQGGLMHYQPTPPMAVVGVNDIWTCGYRSGMVSGSNYQISHWTPNGWHNWIELQDGDFYAFDIRCQPVNKDIWVTIKSLQSNRTGVCKYVQGLPAGFTSVHHMPDPGALGFADQNNLIAFSRYMNQPTAMVCIYNGSTWTDYPCYEPLLTSMVIGCYYSDPVSKTAYAISNDGKVLRFQNGTLTLEDLHCQLYDIYMTGPDTGWICAEYGLYRKISGGAWVEFTDYPGQKAFSIDKMNDIIWIAGEKDGKRVVHRLEDNRFYEETTADINKARLRMFPDQLAEPYQGYMMDDVQILNRSVE
jgi:hypothetical protein